MGIKEILNNSLKDYPGKIAPILFFGGCNYKCPACHARNLVLGNLPNKYTVENIVNYINENKDWIDGTVLCGGEPTLQIDIIQFIEKLKGTGVSIKLDTNGNSFSVLQELLKDNLVDYVAMDVKGPPNLYAQIVGKKHIDLRDDVEKGISIIQSFPDCEYRTTVVPVIRENGKISWMTIDEIVETAKWIVNETGINEHKYFLQSFIARSKDEMIDERFSKDNLPQEMWQTPDKLIHEYLEIVKKYLPNAKIR